MNRSSKGSVRANQIASVIHRGVQSVISGGFADPRLEGVLITVTQVKVTSDTQLATISISVMPEQHERRVMHALKDASKHIRRETAEAVHVHRMPEFVFKIDKTLKRQAAALDAIALARAEFEDEDSESPDTNDATTSPTHTDPDPSHPESDPSP